MIEELTKEREEKLAKALEAQALLTEEELEKQEENKIETDVSLAVKKHTHKSQYLSTPKKNTSSGVSADSSPVSPLPPSQKLKSKASPKKRPNNELANKMPSIMIDALSQTYEETKQLLYSEAAATYIQRLWRGRVQRLQFLKQLNIRKYQVRSE